MWPARSGRGFDVAEFNPGQACDFARAMGYLAKTDRTDTIVPEQIAAVIRRHPQRERFIRTPPDVERQLLTAMGERRRLLNTILVAERNRLCPAHPLSRKSINIIIKALEEELVRIDEDMNHHLQNHFKEHAERLSGIKGVGNHDRAALLAEVPEPGRLSRREISAFMGVAPVNSDPGIMRGRRTIFGGRTYARRCTWSRV